MNKTKAQRIHSMRRIEERLGFEISAKKLVEKIQLGDAKFLYKRSKRVSVFRFKNEDLDIVAVYDRSRKQIITVYPYKGSNEERKINEQSKKKQKANQEKQHQVKAG